MSFIAIKINGDFIDLPPSTVINFEIENPIFDDGNIKGTLSFPFTVDQTKRNKKIFGLPEIIGNKNVTRIFDCEVFLGGSSGALFLTGIFRIRRIANSKYVCNLTAAAATLAEDVRKKKLSDLELGGVRNIVPFPITALKLTGSGTSGNVTIQILNLQLFTPFNSSINQTLIDLAALFVAHPDRELNGIGDVQVAGDVIKFYSNAVGVYPNYIDVASSGGTGRTLTRTDGEVLDMQDHMEEHLAVYPDVDYVFFPVKNPGAYGDSPGDYGGYINYYTAGKFPFNAHVGEVATEFLKYPICPFPYFLYVLKQVFTEHNYTTFGNFLDDPEIKKLTIYNNYLLDLFWHNLTFNNWQKSIDLRNHVPDISIADFLKELKKFFSLGYFFDLSTKRVEIVPLKDILASVEYDDWTSIAEPSLEIEMTEGAGYTLKYSRDDDDDLVEERNQSIEGLTILDPVENFGDLPAASASNAGSICLIMDWDEYYIVEDDFDGTTHTYGWAYYSDNIWDYQVGDGKTELSNIISAISHYRPLSSPSLPDKSWLVPYVNQECGSPYIGKNSFSFRLLFYRGLHSDGDANSYPLATTHPFNYNTTNIGNYSLGADGEYGMVEQWNKNWINFLINARPVTKPIRFTLPDLLNLNLKRQKRIDNQNYLVRKISLQITMRGIGKATADLYTK